MMQPIVSNVKTEELGDDVDPFNSINLSCTIGACDNTCNVAFLN